jgi:hypothetical protein
MDIEVIDAMSFATFLVNLVIKLQVTAIHAMMDIS